MGFFQELFGALSTATSHSLQRSQSNGHTERGRMDRLCSELSWPIDERNGDTIRLHFNDPNMGTVRKVNISSGDDALILFAVYSFAILPGRDVPEEVIGHLLSQNGKVATGAWAASVLDDGNVLFYLMYRAFGSNFTAAALKYTCDTMLREASEFDLRMKRAGLLK